MGDILIDNQTTPTTPAAGKSVIWVDSTAKKLVQTDDGGVARGGTLSKNYLTSQLTGFATDTYITGSSILIPAYGMQIGQVYQWQVCIEKSALGTAAPICTVRTGTNQSTADTSRAALTSTVAQTATASVAIMFVSVLVRTVSASGVIVASMGFTNIAGSSTAGFGDGDRVVSSTFDNSAFAGSYIGLSLNGGTSASYTIDSAFGYLIS